MRGLRRDTQILRNGVRRFETYPIDVIGKTIRIFTDNLNRLAFIRLIDFDRMGGTNIVGLQKTASHS